MSEALNMLSKEQESAIFMQAAIEVKNETRVPQDITKNGKLENYRQETINNRNKRIEEIKENLDKIDNAMQNASDNKKLIFDALNGDEQSAVFVKAQLETANARQKGGALENEHKTSYKAMDFIKNQIQEIASNPVALNKAISNFDENKNALMESKQKYEVTASKTLVSAGR